MPTMPPLDPLEVLGVPRARLPRHIAIIMDGNGRWARDRGLSRLEGHRHGSQAVREIVTQCARLGVECLTLYSFSVDNWKRPPEEVAGLMALYSQYLADERQEIMDNDIRLVQLGRRADLPEQVLQELDQTMGLSAKNTGMTLCVALNYGARSEIVDAVRTLARRVAAGQLDPDEIDERLVSESLYTADLPDPDLLIRTGGEMRVSNFLLWQISYAELYVTPVLWPDFRPEHLHEAIRSFAARERRFGDVRSAATTEKPKGAP
jgi:undecaprenyl diphosphate synthase